MPDQPIALTSLAINALRTAATRAELVTLLEAIVREMGFRCYALIDHDEPNLSRTDRVDLMDYPGAITDYLFQQRRYRRDPVIRACCFADSAFLWSDLSRTIQLDRRDRASFEMGRREGLNEGVTVPFARLGDCLSSCTFAGTRAPEAAERYIGPAQMIGIFAFKGARRLVSKSGPKPTGGKPSYQALDSRNDKLIEKFRSVWTPSYPATRAPT